MQLITVKSSNIKAVGFEKGVLTVQFHSGHLWEYSPVGKQLFDEMLKASSIGAFFIERVKNNPIINARKINT